MDFNESVDYCLYILEHNVLDSRYIIYYSGTESHPNFSNISKDVWATAWNLAKEVMIENKDLHTLWVGIPANYFPIPKILHIS